MSKSENVVNSFIDAICDTVIDYEMKGLESDQIILGLLIILTNKYAVDNNIEDGSDDIDQSTLITQHLHSTLVSKFRQSQERLHDN